MLFEMVGSQAITLKGGRVIPPLSGAFEASEREMPTHLLAWFEQIGAVRKAQASEEPAPDPMIAPVRRRRLSGDHHDDETKE